MKIQTGTLKLMTWFLVGALLALSVAGCERDEGNRDTDEVRIPRVLYLENMKAAEFRERPAFTEAEREQMREEVTSRILPIAQRHVDLIVHQPNFYDIDITLLCQENGDYTETMGIQIWVSEKVPDEDLPEADRMPATLEGVLVQFIVAPETLYPQFFPQH